MKMNIYTPLQIREIFHIEFLRWLGRKIKPENYAVKGGTNLRLFFKSFRYSEDMDLDARIIGIHGLKEAVMGILESKSFLSGLKPFGIEKIAYPDISKAKQTQTTQRFKTHLITSSGEDLFTKVEFSRRGFAGNVVAQPASNDILRSYKLPPLIVPHYDIDSAIAQKIEALASRSVIQARDIFDLYILSTQSDGFSSEKIVADDGRLKKAHQNVFEISFEQFRDTVISYLSLEDQAVYNSSSLWDDIRLKVSRFIEEIETRNV
jgi:predicted nucleotidyltransferase component of viral defense system